MAVSRRKRDEREGEGKGRKVLRLSFLSVSRTFLTYP
jgi:hypothetical protein